MLGFLVTLTFGGLLLAVGAARLARMWPGADPAERAGVGLMLGLGLVGWLTFFVGLIPGGVRWVWFPWAVLALGAAFSWRDLRPELLRMRRPVDREVLFPAVLVLLFGIAAVNALAPSDTADWDTLAYHLAVPKLWIEAGRADPVPFIHHSHFPFAVDNLYLWGLQWGGEAGAKAFTVLFALAGTLAVFGGVRRRWGAAAAPWAALAWLGAPVILWQAGSGYIDAAHGLFAGWAAVYLLERTSGRTPEAHGAAPWWVPGLLLGLAIGSKYTGLQFAAVLALVGVVQGVRTLGAPTVLRGAAVVAGLALLVGSPWYVRNEVVAQNPVYPFFSERLGGANWDAWRASIYRDEQQTFGVGRTGDGRDPAAWPSAVLGLGYQPGRYINPNQTQGGGFPMGAVGAVLALAWPLWLTTGRGRRQPDVGALAVWVGVSLALWFFLSQQARYIAALAPALAWTIGALLAQAPWRRAVPALIGLQTAYTAGLLFVAQTQSQLPVALGRVDPAAYREARVPFARAAVQLNQLGPEARVALFDEVFGYLLDVPYFWANPGHGTFVDYDAVDGPDAWADALRRLGITHVYVNLAYTPGEAGARWVGAMGLAPGEPWSDEERAAMDRDPNLKWKRLLADAVRAGRLVPQPLDARSAVLFQLR